MTGKGYKQNTKVPRVHGSPREVVLGDYTEQCHLHSACSNQLQPSRKEHTCHVPRRHLRSWPLILKTPHIFRNAEIHHPHPHVCVICNKGSQCMTDLPFYLGTMTGDRATCTDPLSDTDIPGIMLFTFNLQQRHIVLASGPCLHQGLFDRKVVPISRPCWMWPGFKNEHFNNKTDVLSLCWWGDVSPHAFIAVTRRFTSVHINTCTCRTLKGRPLDTRGL